MASADDLIEEALRGQRPEFAAEVRRAYRRADPITKTDMIAFYASNGPSRVRERILKKENGTPTNADLGKWLAE